MLSVDQEIKSSPSVQAKWGDSVTSGQTGFLTIPDVLVKHQVMLGLDSTDMAIILNIVMHWWNAEEMPHPRPSSIAKQMGVSTRTVERRIKKFEKLELIKRLPSEQRYLGRTKSMVTVRKFDLGGLIKKLEDIASIYRRE